MQNQNEEQLIYLKDLLFSLLYRWKQILLFGMIFALLLGGVKGVDALKTIRASGNSIPAVSESPERTALEKKLETQQAAFNALSAYQQESVMMQVNPYAFYKVSLSLYVAADRPLKLDSVNLAPDPTGAILNSYAAILTSSDATSTLAQMLEVNNEYFNELITINVYSGTGVMDVFVAYPTEEGAKVILQYMLDQLNDSKDSIAQSVAAHQLSIYQSTVDFAEDPLLAEAQALKLQSLSDLRAAMDSTRAEIGSLSYTASDTVSVRTLIRSAVIWCALGFLVGAFFAVALIWVFHISGNKVYSSRTLYNRTKVITLGAINTKKRLCCLMRYLRKLDNRNLTETGLQAKLLAANVKNLCAGKTHLLVTGGAECPALSEELKKAMPDLQVSLCGSLLSSVSAVDALSRCDCVLLVEECETSRYTDVAQSVAMIADNGKQLLGCVLLNG